MAAAANLTAEPFGKVLAGFLFWHGRIVCRRVKKRETNYEQVTLL
jgi:hypothetical protein